MRPLSLHVERFLGIEWAKLQFSSDLFVIVGPNGAGKSSLLEALFFALYGRGIRLERSKRELIHRGSTGKALRVQLEFLLGEERFRVTREYSQKHGGNAYLERYEAERWKPVASGEQGVSQHIEDLLGCDALTFRSSVFLPQGETLAFVEASPADRFKILSSLFGLDILDRVRERVRDDVKALEGELEPLRGWLQSLEAEDLLGEEKRLREEEKELGEALARAHAEERELEGRLEKLERLQKVREELAEARERERNLKAHWDEARRRAQEDVLVEIAQRIRENFERPWLSMKELLQRVVENEGKRLEALKRAEESFATARMSLERLSQEEEIRRRERERLQRLKEEVEAQGKPLVESINGLREEMDLRENERQKVKEWLEEFLKAKADLLCKKEETERMLRERKNHFEEVSLECARIEQVFPLLEETVQEVLQKRRELERIGGDVKRLREELARSEEKFLKLSAERDSVSRRLQALEVEREGLEVRYRQNVRIFVIGELEEEWRESGICPVCGSAVPFPGGVRERVDIVALEQGYRGFQEEFAQLSAQRELVEKRLMEVLEEKARWEKELAEVTQGETELAAGLQRLQGKIRGILEGVGYPELVRFDLSRFREWAREKRESREVLQKEISELERQLTIFEERLRLVVEREKEGKERLQDVEALYQKASGELTQQRALLLEYCALWGVPEGDTPEEAFSSFFEDVLERLRGTEHEVVRLESDIRAMRDQMDFLAGEIARLKEELSGCIREREALSQEEGRLRRRFLEELEKQGWNETEYCHFRDGERGNWREVAHRLEGELQELSRRMAQRIKEKDALLKTVELTEEAAEGRLKEWREKLKELRECIQAFITRVGEVREGLRQNERKKQRWAELKAQIGYKEKEWKVRSDLLRALEAGGFKNYLLRLLFTRLEEEGSRILQEISRGRYTIRMQMRGGVADLVVLDRRFGGGERMPEECSGGEKTLIALALALALSSLKLEEGYARKTECLFIDEGFSSLDREHLDLVADAIFRLSREGKMVGVVTHDPDFAGYFPVQLEVKEGVAQWKRNESIVI